MTFGSCFRELRKKRGLTQEQAAETAGISLRTVIYWEKDGRVPRLPELQMALAALRASEAETNACLRLLRAPRVILLAQERAVESAPAHLGPLPHLGSFLKTLRLRRQWSQEQAAAEMGVHLTTLARWERLDALPAAEDLARICGLLGAMPEEARALASLRLSVPVLPDAAPLETWRERIALFQRQTELPLSPLTDLMALMLRRELWPVAARSPEAQSLLAELDAHYAQWLALRGRTAESAYHARRALETVADRFAPKPFWIEAIRCAAVAAVERPVRAPEQGYRIFKRWHSYFTEPTAQSRIYLSMAEYASQAGRDATALALLGDAETVLARKATPAALRRTQTARARIYTRKGQIQEALDLLPTEPEHDLVSRLIHASLWTNALRKAGESHIARGHLESLCADIATYHVSLYQPYADELISEL